jgi:hypothetical protein
MNLGDMSDHPLGNVLNVDGYFTFDEFAENVLGSSESWQDANRVGHASQHLAVANSTTTNQASPSSMSEGLWSPGFDGTIPKLDRILERGVGPFLQAHVPDLSSLGPKKDRYFTLPLYRT